MIIDVLSAIGYVFTPLQIYSIISKHFHFLLETATGLGLKNNKEFRPLLGIPPKKY